jgi:hypothetical protein
LTVDGAGVILATVSDTHGSPVCRVLVDDLTHRCLWVGLVGHRRVRSRLAGVRTPVPCHGGPRVAVVQRRGGVSGPVIDLERVPLAVLAAGDLAAMGLTGLLITRMEPTAGRRRAALLRHARLMGMALWPVPRSS